MAHLPAYLAATIGPALSYELVLLVGLVILLNLKRLIALRMRRDDRYD